MFTEKIKFVLSRDAMWGDTFGLRMGCRLNDSVPWAVAESVKFRVTTPEEGAIEMPPAMVLKRDDLQSLMDELWSVGIRPTEGTGSAGSLRATERHLEDMRALVFKSNKPQ